MKRSIQLLTLLLGVLLSNSAMAQADLGLKAIGGAIGFVSPQDVSGTFQFGAFADLGTVAPKFRIEPRIDFWTHSEEDFGAKATVNDLTFGVRSKYMFEVANPQFQPYAGAGLGLHFIHGEVSTPATAGFPAMSVSDSQTKLGLDIGGGVMMPVNPMINFMAETWYSFVSDVNQFSLRLGVSRRM